MRHPIRSAVVAAASAALLTAGAGTASAQGSLGGALPFPIDLGSLSALLGQPAQTPGAPAAQLAPAVRGVPPELQAKAFEGRVVAAINEARTAVGAERLVTDPALEAAAGERAAELATGHPAKGDLTAPAGTETLNRTTLALPEGATPQKVLAEMVGDAGMRERMLDGELAKVGVGTATAADGTVHVVLDFGRK